MFASMYASLSGGLMQEKRMTVISNNLANVNTSSFKREIPVFQSYLVNEAKGNGTIGKQGGEEFAANTKNLLGYLNRGTMNVQVGVDKTRVPNENIFVVDSESNIDFGQGSLKPTENQFDLAIDGKGFLEFQTASGVLYSRKGTFQINETGELVDTEGNKLLDSFQQPIKIDQSVYKNIMISEEGEILGSNFEGQSESLGFIKLTEFDYPDKLEKVGNSFYKNNGAKELLPHEMNTKVLQGYIELSNVNIVSEMVQMIDATRGYQAMQKAIKSIDSSTGRLISEIGKPV